MRVKFVFGAYLPDKTKVQIKGNDVVDGEEIITTHINGMPATNEDLMYAVKALHMNKTDFYGVEVKDGVHNYFIDRIYIVTEKGYKEAAKWAE